MWDFLRILSGFILMSIAVERGIHYARRLDNEVLTPRLRQIPDFLRTLIGILLWMLSIFVPIMMVAILTID